MVRICLYKSHAKDESNPRQPNLLAVGLARPVRYAFNSPLCSESSRFTSSTFSDPSVLDPTDPVPNPGPFMNPAIGDPLKTVSYSVPYCSPGHRRSRQRENRDRRLPLWDFDIAAPENRRLGSARPRHQTSSPSHVRVTLARNRTLKLLFHPLPPGRG